MYSKITLIGPIYSIDETKEKTGIIKMSTTRPYMTNDMAYDRDYVELKVWKEYFQSLKPYLYEGQLIAVEGRFECETPNDPTVKPSNYIFAETILKLSSKEQILKSKKKKV